MGELELRLTVPPPVPLRVTVHAPEESGAMVAGVQVIPETVLLVPATSEMVLVLEEPFRAAVTMTV